MQFASFIEDLRDGLPLGLVKFHVEAHTDRIWLWRKTQRGTRATNIKFHWFGNLLSAVTG